MAALSMAALLFSASAAASPLQVAIVYDVGLRDGKQLRPELRVELNAFERGLRDHDPSVQLAFVRCTKPMIAQQFSTLRGIADHLESFFATEPPPCPASVDIVEAALDDLEWKESSEKRILVIGRFGAVLSRGRTTMEQVAHRAEHLGIILDAAEVIGAERGARILAGYGWPDVIRKDLLRFLERPTEPLGRVPVLARHATLLGGGSYRVLLLGRVDRRDLGALENALVDAYPVVRYRDGRDGLLDLAEGARRPSEVKPSELPYALRNVNLEPLLDAVFDFVDARRVTEELVAQAGHLARAGKMSPGDFGQKLAKSVLARKRLMPSRR